MLVAVFGFAVGLYVGGFVLAMLLAARTEPRPYEVVITALLWPSVFWAPAEPEPLETDSE